jgi:hypothetical protein
MSKGDIDPKAIYGKTQPISLLPAPRNRAERRLQQRLIRRERTNITDTDKAAA